MLALRVVTDKKEASKAFDALRKQIRQGGVAERVRIGYRGGQVKGQVHWQPAHGFWSCIPPLAAELKSTNRYLCWFGVENPIEVKGSRTLSITCEINPPREGHDRRLGGVFLSAPRGDVYLAHTGRLGGSGKGISRKPFLDWLGPGRLETLVWPDGKEVQAVLLGAIRSPRFLLRLAEYIHTVRRFKDRKPAVISADLEPKTPAFVPEFQGQRKSYRLDEPIESRSDHGFVVNSLARRLQDEGIAVASDKQRDLVILSPSKEPLILFEVKTSSDSQSLYTGLGQLAFHGAAQEAEPTPVLVLPERPSRKTRVVLQRLGVKVQLFSLAGTEASFPGLENFLREHRLTRGWKMAAASDALSPLP